MLNPSDVKKLLIVNLGGIGDILLSTPALRAIRKKYANASISFAAVPRAYELIRDMPFIDNIFLLDIESGVMGVFGNLKTLSALRRMKFDLAVNMRTLVSKRSALKIRFLFAMINPKVSAGRNTDGRGKFFDISVEETSLGEKYELDYDIDMAKALGAEAHDRNIKIEVPDEDVVKIRKLLEYSGISAGDVVVGINMGGKPSHRWPISNFIKTIEGIDGRIKCKFVMTGSGQDAGLIHKLKIKPGIKIVSMAGELSIKELCAFLKICRLYISNDTGPMHMAAALKTPLVAIFGPGYMRRYDPRAISDKAITLYGKAPCSPCDRIFCEKIY